MNVRQPTKDWNWVTETSKPGTGMKWKTYIMGVYDLIDLYGFSHATVSTHPTYPKHWQIYLLNDAERYSFSTRPLAMDWAELVVEKKRTQTS